MFRQQAVAAAVATEGSASLPAAPIAWRVLGGFVGLAAALVILFIATAEYARKETATGSLVSAAGVVRVAARREGIVVDLKVRDGDRVEAGQALFTIGSQHGLEGGGTLDEALLAGLNTQIRLLREQIAAEPARVANETLRLDAALQTIEAQRQALVAQRHLQAERIAVLEERAKAVSQLYQKGNATRAAHQEQEEALLSRRQSLADLDRQLASVEQDLEQARLQRDQLPVQQGERLSQLRLNLADRERQRSEVEAQRAQVVRAPTAGRVTALQAGLGQSVDPARPLLTLVPEGSELRAELFVPSRAIGFVEPGLKARLMIDAFPYQRFGTYGGTVESVSQAILAPHEVLGRVPLTEPAYRVTVRLDRQTIDAFGRQVALQPDMIVKADIVLEGRSLLAWLFEPILSARGRM